LIVIELFDEKKPLLFTASLYKNVGFECQGLTGQPNLKEKE